MRREVACALVAIVLLAVVVWAVSLFILPNLAAGLRGALVLFFAALAAVIAALAGFKNVLELARFFRRRSDQPSPPALGDQITKTKGGAVVTGEVTVKDGDFVGRDKIVHGDEIHGDKIEAQQIGIVGDYAQVGEIHFHGPPRAVSLHQLPAPPADFTGREAELAELETAIETGGVTISGLRGMGGVGKTALALKLAEQLAPRYPDAQFYLDLKGTDPTPLTAAEALAHVVRAYHPTARLPESEGELGGLYRSVLHGQRALLLMDNAANRAQVEPLLPPAGCLLLVTSRQHFVLPGLRALNLDALPPDDARRLLLKIAPRSEACASEIAELCGYLPLALRLAGSALAERADLSPARYLERLRDKQTRLGLVDASLSLSYELLREELQQRWAMLAVFPGTFDGTAAAAAWAMDPEPAADALSELVRHSLVEWDAETSRYRLHDLARLFADARLGAAERATVQRRHAAHYEAVLHATDQLYQQGGEALLRGLGCQLSPDIGPPVFGHIGPLR